MSLKSSSFFLLLKLQMHSVYIIPQSEYTKQLHRVIYFPVACVVLIRVNQSYFDVYYDFTLCVTVNEFFFISLFSSHLVGFPRWIRLETDITVRQLHIQFAKLSQRSVLIVYVQEIKAMRRQQVTHDNYDKFARHNEKCTTCVACS